VAGLSVAQALFSALIGIGAVVGLCLTSAHAGPCTAQIAEIEEATRSLGASLNAVPAEPQSKEAQLHRQPTVGSVAEAEQKSKADFDAKLAQAKTLDAEGKADECMGLVAELKNRLAPNRR
jgi:hypothetical protein